MLGVLGLFNLRSLGVGAGGQAVKAPVVFALAASLLLSSCGRPDASGIYVRASDREVTLVQLVQADDGRLTGRMEDVTIGADGVVKDQTVAMDGAASKHDLMFKPASAWYGGLGGTGTFSRDSLTLVGTGFSLSAQRSTLDAYKAAVARLQTVAAGEREKLAALQAQQAERAAAAQAAAAQQAAEAQAASAEAERVKAASDKAAKLEAAAAQLHEQTLKLNAALAASPDFGQRSASNTARVARMLQAAPGLSGVARNQLIVAANQVVVGTNQIEVARSQYAIGLNQIVRDAAPLADQLQKFCASPEGAAFAGPCASAAAAATDFQASLQRGTSAFNGYKQAVRDDLARQTAMIQRMGG